MATALELPSTPLDEETFSLIHPESLRDPAAIRALLERMQREGVPLRRGMNKMIEPEQARLESVNESGLLLRGRNFAATGRTQLFLNAELDGRPYFFSAQLISNETDELLHTSLPDVIWKVERRDRRREPSKEEAARWVELRLDHTPRATGWRAQLADTSEGGAGLWLPEPVELAPGDRIQIDPADRIGLPTAPRSATVRNLRDAPERPGWLRIGVAFDAGPATDRLQVEERAALSPVGPVARFAQTIGTGVGAARATLGHRVGKALGLPGRPPPIEVVRYETAAGEAIKAIIDSTGDTRGAPVVVIPPAWGRTKETLAALAMTMIESFKRANRPLVVVRFDGVRKRGESYNDPECRAPGKEHLRFTFSQGVRDLEATLDFLESDVRFRPSQTVLVSFSASAIEARTFVARDRRRRVDGWVSVVGAPDIQSMMRTISGGVDYMLGAERGGRFGVQEVLGVLVDIDYAAQDANAQGMSFLEDARRDMEQIEVPVVWIRGKYDGWMDRSRIIEVLATGPCSQRRLIEVPSGHQIKSSREAIEIFQLVTSEVSAILLGKPLRPAPPDVVHLMRRQRAERARLPRSDVDLTGFWRTYLLGRDGKLGIDLLNETSSYRRMMARQIERLELAHGDTVLDLGCGTGSFPRALRGRATPRLARLVGLDLVEDALDQWREEAEALPGPPSVESVCVNLAAGRLPFPDEHFEAVMASLLFGYVTDPATLFREIARVLKPGGRLVLSALRPDADISLIYADGLAEIDRGELAQRFDRSASALRESAHAVLNQASRIVDMEEQGTFEFPELESYRQWMSDAGLVSIDPERALGDPPQALLIRAQRA